MSVTYRAIDWNRQKRRYDLWLVASVVLALGAFTGVSLRLSPHFTAETLILRSTAVAAFLLLHLVLCIGPLCRLQPRFLPLLYNRRHLGVTLFLLGAIHATFATIQFHALGDVNPLESIFSAYSDDYRILTDGRVNLAHFPFEPFGAFALVILFLMAATSHDFWLRTLGASFWKTLHFGAYAVYGLILVHIALGILQSERSTVYPSLIAIGFTLVAGLHLAAARQERRFDFRSGPTAHEGFVAACTVQEVPGGHGKVVVTNGHRIALFRQNDRIFATSNVCRHQGGPLGEGRMVDNCITCPWHGWNYRPEDGCSPPPFQERIETYETRIVGDTVLVRLVPNPPGTRVAGSPVPISSL